MEFVKKLLILIDLLFFMIWNVLDLKDKVYVLIDFIFVFDCWINIYLLFVVFCW